MLVCVSPRIKPIDVAADMASADVSPLQKPLGATRLILGGESLNVHDDLSLIGFDASINDTPTPASMTEKESLNRPHSAPSGAVVIFTAITAITAPVSVSTVGTAAAVISAVALAALAAIGALHIHSLKVMI